MIINYETYVLIILIILIILIFHIHLYFNKIEEFTTPESIYGNYENHTGKYGIKCVKDCQTGYAGPNCNTLCNITNGELPKPDKTACMTIGNNEYIGPGPNREVIKFTKDSDKYRNPDDATQIFTLPDDKYRYVFDGRIIFNISDIPGDDVYRIKGSNHLNWCPVCTTTQYSTGSCGGSTVNDKECFIHSNPSCPEGQEQVAGTITLDTHCEPCQRGYVGIGCSIKCDPIKGEIPRDDKTACKTIGSNKYIDPNDDTKEKSIPSNKYRNPNDARLLNDCSSCSSDEYKTGGCSGTTDTTCANNSTPRCLAGQWLYRGNCYSG